MSSSSPAHWMSPSGQTVSRDVAAFILWVRMNMIASLAHEIGIPPTHLAVATAIKMTAEPAVSTDDMSLSRLTTTTAERLKNSAFTAWASDRSDHQLALDQSFGIPSRRIHTETNEAGEFGLAGAARLGEGLG